MERETVSYGRLAKRLTEAGQKVSKAHLHMIAHGTSMPSIELACAIERLSRGVVKPSDFIRPATTQGEEPSNAKDR